jgi:hypothetical protein
MSISAVPSSSPIDSSAQGVLSKRTQVANEFKQLGHDLQSGDVSASQSDYVTLQQLVPSLGSSAPQTFTPLAQAFGQIGQALQSGNIGSAQQAYSQIQQGVQHQDNHNNFKLLGKDLQSGNLSGAQSDYAKLQQATPGSNSTAPDTSNPRLQAFNQIGQDLQSGNTSAALQVYTQIQQSFQQNGANSVAPAQSSPTPVSVAV